MDLFINKSVELDDEIMHLNVKFFLFFHVLSSCCARQSEIIIVLLKLIHSSSTLVANFSRKNGYFEGFYAFCRFWFVRLVSFDRLKN